MITMRFVGAQVLGHVMLVLVAVAGLLGLGSSVEAAELGMGGALWHGLLLVPALLPPLTPLVVAVGVTLAVVRMEARGERLALEALGVGPWRTVPAVVLVGLGLGVGQWVLAGSVAPAGLELAGEAVGSEPAPFVWIDGVAVRVEDGERWRLRGAQLEQLAPELPAPEAVRTARMLQQPARASHRVLATATTPPAVVERQGRLARVLACGLLAVLCWLPSAQRLGGADRVGVVGAACLVWLGLDLGLRSLGAQAHLMPALAAWGGVLALMLGVGGAWLRSRPARSATGS